MKLLTLLLAPLLFAPAAAHALERDIRGVVLLGLDAGLLLPAPTHTDIDYYDYQGSATEWTHPGARIGASVGIGLTRTVGVRLRFDTHFLRYEGGSGRIIGGGLDVLGCFGNPDSLLLRPFGGVGFSPSNGTSHLFLRGGLDFVLPFSDEPDANGWFARFMVEADFASNEYGNSRLAPQLSAGLGVTFDL